MNTDKRLAIWSPLFLAATLLLSGCVNDESPEHTGPAPLIEDLWQTDYEAALARAAEEGKPVLLNFTGSDWCPPCIAMDKEVFQEKTFRAHAADNFILVKLDFPRRVSLPPEIEEQNYRLATQYGKQAYPTFVVLTPGGEEVDRHVGFRRGGPRGMIEWIQSAAE